MNKRLTERAIKRLDKIIAFAKSHRWHRDPSLLIAANARGEFYVGDFDKGYSYCGEGFFLAPSKGREDETLCFLRAKVKEVINKRLKNKDDFSYGEHELSEYSDYYATSKRCIISLFERTKKNLEKELNDSRD